MMSAPSSDETSDQRFSLRSATVLQLQTFRVICQPQDMEEEFVQWRISPIEVQMAPEETAPIHALVGDLAVGAGEWFVGATASMVFAASDDEVDETAMRGDLTAVAQRYGPWAARVLLGRPVALRTMSSEAVVETSFVRLRRSATFSSLLTPGDIGGQSVPSSPR